MQRPDLPMKSNTLPRKISAPARPIYDSTPRQPLITSPDTVYDALQKFVKSYGSEEMSMNDVMEKLRAFKIGRDALVKIYNWVFDQHDKERFHAAEIVCESASRNLIVTSDLLEALKEIIDAAQDSSCDLPHVYTYIGQLLALLLLKRIVHFKDLLEISKTEIEGNNGATVLKNVLRVFETKYDKPALTQLYQEAGCDFQQFLDSETKLGEFLKENVSFC
jgi:translation initiation factor 4G